MKFETTPRFDNDYSHLKPEWRQDFRSHIADFNTACEAHIAAPGSFVWPARLRVSRMTSVADVWAMTWSFASPDGRATFQFIDIDAAPAVLWRRVGNHTIYKQP